MNTTVSPLPRRKSGLRPADQSLPIQSDIRDNSAEMPLGEALVAAGLIRREDLEG